METIRDNDDDDGGGGGGGGDASPLVRVLRGDRRRRADPPIASARDRPRVRRAAVPGDARRGGGRGRHQRRQAAR